MPLDLSRTFVPMRIAVLTVSDTRTLETDTSGRTLVERAEAAGHRVVERAILSDERSAIAARIRSWAASGTVDVVLCTGGTGVTARDVTPEAVRDVLHKEIPGFGEMFRALSVANIGTSTVQSRALAGVVERTYVFALPGSTGACKDAWDGILVHQLDSRHRPCNFAELLPRLVHDRGDPQGIGVQEVEGAVMRWCAAVEAGHVEGLARMYTEGSRLALPDAGHEGPKVIATAVVALLGGRALHLDSLGGVQIEPGGTSATDVGALVEAGQARFVTTMVWRKQGGQLRLHLQQVAPAH